MTYDEMLAGSSWSGANRELRSRMAEYVVDGERLGSIDWPTRSGDPDDTMLDRRSREVLGTALVLGIMGHEDVGIATLDSSGRRLDQPDLDVKLLGGDLAGVEQADVVSTAQAKHEAESALLTNYVRNLLNSDAAFASAFGNRHVTIFLSNHLINRHHIEGKSTRLSLQAEITHSILASEHCAADGGSFPSRYPNLQMRGATWYSNGSEIPLFDIGHGLTRTSADPGLADVIRVLNNHRVAAADYRNGPLWIVLLLTDRWDFLRNALDAVMKENPTIAPFERCYLADDRGRVLELRSDQQPTFVGMFAPR